MMMATPRTANTTATTTTHTRVDSQGLTCGALNGIKQTKLQTERREKREKRKRREEEKESDLVWLDDRDTAIKVLWKVDRRPRAVERGAEGRCEISEHGTSQACGGVPAGPVQRLIHHAYIG